MATADEYATWIVKNAAKKGTPEFDTVARAYQQAKAEEAAPQQDIGIPGARVHPNFFKSVGDVAVPTVMGLGSGAIGTFFGTPAAGILMAGTGYTAGEELMKYLSNEPSSPLEVGKNLVINTGLEATGGALGKGVAKGVGWLSDALKGQLGEVKAAKILREAFGDQFQAASTMAKTAPPNLTAAQSVANLNAPAAQALLESTGKRTPTAAANKLATERSQEAARVNQLSSMASGATQTEAKTAQKGAKKRLNEQLIPTLEAELKDANKSGKVLTTLREQEQRAASLAAEIAEAERKFNAAKGFPVKGSYTYIGDPVKKAEKDMVDAAVESSKTALKNITAQGLKPLKTESIISKIDSVLKNPRSGIAGNTEAETALKRVASTIQKWTDNNGVIDGFALDKIRTHSINSAVLELLPNADAKAQKALAAKLTSEVRPLIVEAIEQAGGTGYGRYLKDYAAGSQLIAQKKLSAKALELYETNPESFVKLVKGNSPEEVEKVFGPGSYDIALEMSQNVLARLKKVAGEVNRDKNIAEQVTAGADAYRQVLIDNTSKFRLPSKLSLKTTAANAAIAQLEGKISKSTMNKLTDATKSGADLAKLLDTLPTSERNIILKKLSGLSEFAAKRRGAATAALQAPGKISNALAPENQNNLGNE